MLKEELDGLNSRDKEFTVIDTGAKYTLFISLSSVDSNQVAKSIYQVRKLLFRIVYFTVFFNRSLILILKYIESTQKPIGRYVSGLIFLFIFSLSTKYLSLY
jgi:hypothetical protein